MDEGAAVKESFSGRDQYSFPHFALGQGSSFGLPSVGIDREEDFFRLGGGLSP
jgi:hypothetical protein